MKFILAISITFIFFLLVYIFNEENDKSQKKIDHNLQQTTPSVIKKNNLPRNKTNIKTKIASSEDLRDILEYNLRISDNSYVIDDNFNTVYSFNVTNVSNKVIDAFLFSVTSTPKYVDDIFKIKSSLIDYRYKYSDEIRAFNYTTPAQMRIKRIIKPNKTSKISLYFYEQLSKGLDIKVIIHEIHFKDGTVNNNVKQLPSKRRYQ